MVWVLDWCFICKRAGETLDHLLLHCEYASELWYLVFCLFGVYLVMPHTVLELLSCWRRRASQRGHSAIWNAIPLCLMWLLWRERDRRAFEASKCHTLELKMLCPQILFDWMDALSSHSFPFVHDYIDSCS